MSATRLQGLALTALAALACAAPGAGDAGAGAAAQVPPLGRILVVPLNLGLRTPAELRGRQGPVWTELVHYLEAQDRSLGVVDVPGAQRLWAEARADLERSGAATEPRACAERFAQLLARHAEYDVLVMPSLVLRRARVGGRQAWWDGARRPLPVRDPLLVASELEDALPGVTVSGHEGTIAAASLYVAVLSARGETLYEGLSGLDVIQVVTREGSRPHATPALRLEPRRDAFADAAGVREGIERAFARPLPETARADAAR